MTASNLPAIITGVGGALEIVISDIETYTDNRYPLNRRSQFALARLIEDRPELNSEPRVSLLVDALSYHGVNQLGEFTKLIDSNDIELVHFALDYLFEVGYRDRGTTTTATNPKHNSMKCVHQVIDVIIKLHDMEIEVDDVEHLDTLIHQLGGLDRAINASDEEIDSLHPRNMY